jgi:nucleotide-binding universal stress UspA family protein
MRDIQNIVVPIDFHQHTDRLVDFAIGIANKLEAKITFLYVGARVEYHSEFRPELAERIDTEIQSLAEKKMTALLKEAEIICPTCTGLVLAGNVADSVVEYAREHNIDLIIIGTHGARGIGKILLGSGAERVLKLAHCPTLIFNPYKGE